MSFSQLCRPKSRVLSPERKKEIATQLNNCGFQLPPTPGAKVDVPGVGINLTKRECYELAITMDPTLAEAYYNLGTILHAGECATLGALMLDEGECFRRAVELDETMAPAWFNLGVSLKASNNANTKSIFDLPASLQGENHQQYFFTKTNPETGIEYPIVLINGEEFEKRDCYVKALDIDPDLPYAWFNLGIALGAADCVCVREDSYSDLECFVRALNLDDTIGTAWAMTGRRLLNIESSDEAFSSHQRSSMMAANTTANADGNIQQENENDESQQQQKKPTIDVKGTLYTAHQCFVKSLCLDPKNSSVWFLAGVSLQDDSSFFEVLGKMYDKQTAFEMSLDLFQYRSVVWYELGATLQRKKSSATSSSPTNRVYYGFVKGQKVTPISCFKMSLELDEFQAPAWFNIGVLLGEKETIVIDEEELTEQNCFEKCLSIDSSISLGWFNLGACLNQAATMSNNNKNKTEGFVANQAASSQQLAAAEPEPQTQQQESRLNNAPNREGSPKATVAEEQFSKAGCFVQSIAHNPRHRASWFHLGKCLDDKAVATTAEKVTAQKSSASTNASFENNEITPQFLFTRSSSAVVGNIADPRTSSSNSNGNSNYEDDEEQQQIGEVADEDLEREFAVAEAIELLKSRSSSNYNSTNDPVAAESSSWAAGNKSSSSNSNNLMFVQLSSGSVVDAKACYEKCIELDGSDINAWKRLARSMNKGEHVLIKGKEVSRDDCMKKIVSLSGK